MQYGFTMAPQDQPTPKSAAEAQAALQAGLAHHRSGALDQARAHYEAVLAFQPHNADVLHLLGLLAGQTGDHEAAADLIGRAISIRSDNAGFHYNRALALQQLNRFPEALACYDAALALRPDHVEALNNRGVALKKLGLLEEARESFDRTLALRPDFAEALRNRGGVLLELKRYQEALADFSRALALKPKLDSLFGQYLHTKMLICDWDGFADNVQALAVGVAAGENITVPGALFALTDDPALQQAAAATWLRGEIKSVAPPLSLAKRAPGDKIRLGYYSADFHGHATSYLMAELFEAHDRDRFDLYAFSFGPNSDDDMRRRVASAFHAFIDINDRSDREIAALSRELGIDIAVDLKGLTTGARPGMFAERCAPIQVNYLGYPGTMGAAFIDYIIADRVVLPPEIQSCFTEKVVYLPHSYQPSDSRRQKSGETFTRKGAGLPEQGLVFSASTTITKSRRTRSTSGCGC